jgi:hypothetical protein
MSLELKPVAIVNAVQPRFTVGSRSPVDDFS